MEDEGVFFASSVPSERLLAVEQGAVPFMDAVLSFVVVELPFVFGGGAAIHGDIGTVFAGSADVYGSRVSRTRSASSTSATGDVGQGTVPSFPSLSLSPSHPPFTHAPARSHTLSHTRFSLFHLGPPFCGVRRARKVRRKTRRRTGGQAGCERGARGGEVQGSRRA
eukprot:3013692-Rhodomonas_salina.1